MEIKVNRVYWSDNVEEKETIKTKYIYYNAIETIEESGRCRDYTDVITTYGEQFVINEPLKDFKLRLDIFKKKKEEDEEEAARNRDLGI